MPVHQDSQLDRLGDRSELSSSSGSLIEVESIPTYTEILRNYLTENEDRPIPLQSLHQIVVLLHRLQPAIAIADSGTQSDYEELTELLTVIHEVVLLVEMTVGQRAIITHGRAAMLVLDSPEKDAIRGYKMWYMKCTHGHCCEAPGMENFDFITDSSRDETTNRKKNIMMEVNRFEPLQGRSYILILFNPQYQDCTVTAYVIRANADMVEETTEEFPTYDYEYDDITNESLGEEYIDENVQQVLDDLGVLLQNETVSFSAETVHQAFDQVDVLLEDENDVEIPGQLIHMLDELGARVALKGGQTGAAVRDNVALLVADSRPDKPVRGIRLATGKHGMFKNETFEFITGEVPSVSSSGTDAVLFLPPSVMEFSRRISFVVFRNGRAFHHVGAGVVNSHVLSVNVENFTSLAPGEVVEIQLSPFRTKIRRNESRKCAYWDFGDNGTGFWSQNGCTFIEATQNDSLDICRCDHLTHFAQIIISRDVFSELHEDILRILSVIGNSFSIFGLIIVALTAIIFKQWRRNESNRIWLHLCMAVFVLDVCFIVTVFAEFNQNDIVCIVLGISLHYSVLTTFCWMLVVSILSYRKLVLVFTNDIRRKLWYAAGFSWGLPFFVIGLLVVVDNDAYSKEFEEKAPSANFCYPSGVALWLTLYCPIFVIWVVNLTLYMLITKNMYMDRNIRRHSGVNDSLQNASVSCLLAFLCGIPWVFGFFAFNIVAAYLFTLTTSFQGFVLFIFFVLGTNKTRNLWINLFRHGATGKTPVSYVGSSERNQSSASNVTSRFYVPKPVTSTDESSNELLSESRL